MSNTTWKESTAKHYWSWYEARSFETDEWVLPSVQQLREARDNNTSGFFEENYWTSDHEESGRSAAFFNYTTGDTRYVWKSNTYCVRLVKSQKKVLL